MDMLHEKVISPAAGRCKGGRRPDAITALVYPAISLYVIIIRFCSKT